MTQSYYSVNEKEKLKIVSNDPDQSQGYWKKSLSRFYISSSKQLVHQLTTFFNKINDGSKDTNLRWTLMPETGSTNTIDYFPPSYLDVKVIGIHNKNAILATAPEFSSYSNHSGDGGCTAAKSHCHGIGGVPALTWWDNKINLPYYVHFVLKLSKYGYKRRLIT